MAIANALKPTPKKKKRKVESAKRLTVHRQTQGQKNVWGGGGGGGLKGHNYLPY